MFHTWPDPEPGIGQSLRTIQWIPNLLDPLCLGTSPHANVVPQAYDLSSNSHQVRPAILLHANAKAMLAQHLSPEVETARGFLIALAYDCLR